MILDTGLIPYEESFRLQSDMVRKRKSGEVGDSLLITEHRPVFTVGRRSGRDNLLVSEALLKKNGVSVINTDRGGDITFHGPGQLIIYPILDLKKRARDLHKYLRDLEEVAIGFLNEYSIQAGRVSGRTGVWIEGKKIAFIGIAASDWITYHGMSINVNIALDYFSMINPCGMADIEVTSIKRVLGRDISIDRAKIGVVSHFKYVFGPVAE